jgi:hypothetical protein
LVVEDGLPSQAKVICFPYTAIIHADVKYIGLRGHTHSTYGTASAMGTDHAPFNGLIISWINLLSRRPRQGDHEQQKDKERFLHRFGLKESKNIQNGSQLLYIFCE